MQLSFVCACLLAASVLASGQQPPQTSPARTASAIIAGKTITIDYNSPKVRGRAGHIFSKDGQISHDPHYPVWRAGANAATTLRSDADLKIGDLAVPKGEYTLFVDISDPDHWVLIVSKKTGEWGLDYDSSQDLGRTRMKMSKPTSMVEDLTYTITDLGGTTGKIELEWENHSALVLLAVH